MSEIKKKITNCINLKLLSYIVGIIIGLVSFCILALCIYIMVIYDNPEEQAKKNEDGSIASWPFRGYVIVFLFATFTLFCSGLLMRGIKANHANYVMPFVLWIGLLVCVLLVRAVLSFITGSVHREEFSVVLKSFLKNVAVGTGGLILYLPVYIFYSKMDTTPYYPAITEYN